MSSPLTRTIQIKVDTTGLDTLRGIGREIDSINRSVRQAKDVDLGIEGASSDIKKLSGDLNRLDRQVDGLDNAEIKAKLTGDNDVLSRLKKISQDDKVELKVDVDVDDSVARSRLKQIAKDRDIDIDVDGDFAAVRRDLERLIKARSLTVEAEASTASALRAIKKVADDREVKINAILIASSAKSELNNLIKDRHVDIDARLDSASATASLKDIVQPRTAKVTAHTETESARSQLNDLEKPLNAKATAHAETESARSQLNDLERARHTNITAILDDAVAQSKLKNLIKGRDVKISADFDTSGLERKLKGLTVDIGGRGGGGGGGLIGGISKGGIAGVVGTIVGGKVTTEVAQATVRTSTQIVEQSRASQEIGVDVNSLRQFIAVGARAGIEQKDTIDSIRDIAERIGDVAQENLIAEDPEKAANVLGAFGKQFTEQLKAIDRSTVEGREASIGLVIDKIAKTSNQDQFKGFFLGREFGDESNKLLQELIRGDVSPQGKLNQASRDIGVLTKAEIESADAFITQYRVAGLKIDKATTAMTAHLRGAGTSMAEFASNAADITTIKASSSEQLAAELGASVDRFSKTEGSEAKKAEAAFAKTIFLELKSRKDIGKIDDVVNAGSLSSVLSEVNEARVVRSNRRRRNGGGTKIVDQAVSDTDIARLESDIKSSEKQIESLSSRLEDNNISRRGRRRRPLSDSQRDSLTDRIAAEKAEVADIEKQISFLKKLQQPIVNVTAPDKDAPIKVPVIDQTQESGVKVENPDVK